MRDAGWWMLDTGYSMLDARWWILDTGYSQSGEWLIGEWLIGVGVERGRQKTEDRRQEEMIKVPSTAPSTVLRAKDRLAMTPINWSATEHCYLVHLYRSLVQAMISSIARATM